jgi:hypothetical protein
VRFRDVEPIGGGRLVEAIARTPAHHYVLWTGRPSGSKQDSLRGRALSCVREVGVPVPLRTVLQRAAAIGPEGGLDPDAVRDAVRLHQVASRAVYLLLEQRPDNGFVAVTDIPSPVDGSRIAAGDLVLDAGGRSCLSWLDLEPVRAAS